MPVPVGIRPDRREYVWRGSQGWVHQRDTREHQRKKRREEAAAKKARDHRDEARKRKVAAGLELLFGGD